MLIALVLLVCLGAAIVGGVFFAFSAFVMKALSQLPAGHGVAAMQRINLVVLNPLFMGVFLGTALLSLACIAVSSLSWATPGAAWLLAAGLLYFGGSFLVTVVFNVPRNDRLARLAPASPEAAAYWPVYLREWTRWNHVRALACVASAACSAGFLVH